MSLCECPPFDCALRCDRYLAGDDSAGDELIRKLTPAIEEIARRALGRDFAQEWEEVRQSVAITLLMRMRQWSGIGEFCHWVGVITFNRARSIKSSRRLLPLADDHPVEEPPARNSDLARKECIEAAYKRLPEEWQRIYDLLIQGHSHIEIAKLLGISLRTLQYRLNAIREQFRPCL